MSMRKSDGECLKLTVFVDKEQDIFCHCSGNFYKVCPLRAANDLDCYEAVVRISPIDTDDELTDAEQILKSINPKKFAEIRNRLNKLPYKI